MKVKEMTLASILIAALIAQNYILYSFPITLTYLFFYFIGKYIKSNTITIFSVLVFVFVKNIIYMALPTTIIFDIIGLMLIVFVSKIKINYLKYIILPILIIIHILMLDFSTALLTDNILAGMIANLTTGFITYIYAPLSIILIVIFDGIEFLSDYQL